MGDFTNKMSLAMWDNIEDPYNYQQFANNWQIVDLHDHTPGRGVQIPGAGIANSAVGTNHLNFTASQIGSWTSLSSYLVTNWIGTGANVRLEGNNDVVRLEGNIQNNTGASFTANTTILTLPAAYRPSATRYLVNMVFSAGTACYIAVNTSGTIACNIAVPNTDYLILDGLTFTL